MNENPEGTPNPLNPAPADKAPVEPAPAETPTETPAEASASVTEVPAETTPTPATEEPVGTVVEPVKKKKTGLIVLVTILVLALIGGGVAAAIFLLGGNGGSGGSGDKDAVSKAIVKLLSSTEGATKLGTEGTIDVTIDNDEVPVSSVSATLNGGYDTESGKSSGKATITATFAGGKKASASIDEVLVNKTLYLKLSGDESLKTNCEGGAADANCVDATDDESAAGVDYSMIINQVVNSLGGQWISMSISDVTSIPGASTDATAQCLIDAISKDKSALDLATIYKNNEFVTSTTENLKVAKKNNPIYKLGLSSTKLASFINAVSDELKTGATAKCIGEVEEVSAEDIEGLAAQLPTTYVEVDSNNNFTRLYVNYSTSDGSLGIKADLNLNYNPTVEATAPSSSIKLEDLFSGLMGQANIDFD